jgi:hypothetical protein
MSSNFNGTTAQNITGLLTMNNVTLADNTNVSNNGTILLNGALTLVGASQFDADGGGGGNLTIRSTNVSVGGRIAALPNPGNFIGDVTIERYINGPDTWRYLSMPLTNGHLGMWRSNFSVTGDFSDATTPAQDPNVLSQTAPSVYRYDASLGTPAYVALSAPGQPTSSVPLGVTTGYSAYVYTPTDFVMTFSGTPFKGSTNATLYSTGSGAQQGFNLIGNPYPSAIDWDAFSLSPDVSGTVYVRTDYNVFASYNQGAGTSVGHPNGTSWLGELAMGQAFWVQALANTPSLDFTEDTKTGTYTYIRKSTPENLLRIKLRTHEAGSDELIIYFNEDATSSRSAPSRYRAAWPRPRSSRPHGARRAGRCAR